MNYATEPTTNAIDSLHRAASATYPKDVPTRSLSTVQQQLADAVARRRGTLADIERVRDRLLMIGDYASLLDEKDLVDARASEGFIADTQSLLDEMAELDKKIAGTLSNLSQLVS